MPLQAITSSEPIPGYRIRERIGAGGYGEVWTADAPGGLVKAIKFVYGFLNEDRASRELKALNRIKTVRHPFLLSLERIEVVDGQLLIVTELAEASLKDRYDQHRQNGLPGIPRAELIRYMRDTADVLDFMNEEHSLQHLDIKPENLLMLAGRVKVADFGLVKDIHDATASLMGGLTPLYAPPEVFDGRPSRRSDQYSLAIVFQEMLTGELPFPGTTAMQLARQHLHARPRVSALPQHDQDIILRALSKSPGDRFSNCRELVDLLERAEERMLSRAAEMEDAERRPQGAVRSFVGDRCAERGPNTEMLGDVGEVCRPADGSEASVPRVHATPSTTNLNPIEIREPTNVLTPTVYLGLGRSAGRVLLQLRKKLSDRFGRLQDMPTIQMMMIDTDTKDLLALTQHRNGFQTHELVAIPLRHPQDYRNDSGRLLRWLSRRWLYNIPKSLKTEGLRPLGRLAFVDHAQTIADRIRAAIASAANQESVSHTREATGLPFQDGDVRIVIVSSVSGGTGSGMLIDMGYLARHLLAEQGFGDNHVMAVLTHSTGRTPREMELASVNAYSTLCELNHCSRDGGYYPGEKSCGLPPRETDSQPFRDTYLIDLGSELGEPQFDDAAGNVASYLYLDAVTSATSFFDACRKTQPKRPVDRSKEMLLRTFGVHQFSCLQDDIMSVAVEHLCRHAADRWLVGSAVQLDLPAFKRSAATVTRSTDRSAESDYNSLAVSVERFVEAIRLDVDSLVQEMLRHVEHELGQSVNQFLEDQTSKMDREALQNAPQSCTAAIAQFIASLDAVLGRRTAGGDATSQEVGSLEKSLVLLRKKSTLKRTDAIHEWLLDRVDDDVVRIRGSLWLARWLADYCKGLEERVLALRDNVRTELTEAERILASPPPPSSRLRGKTGAEEIPALLDMYCKHRVYECVVSSVWAVIKAAKGQVGAVRDELVDLEREIRHLTDQFDTRRTLDSLVGEDDEVGADQLLESVGHVLVEGARELTSKFDERLANSVLKDVGGLRKLLTQGGEFRRKLPGQIRAMALTTVISLMRTLDAADIMFARNRENENSAATLSESLALAKPRLLRCGGGKRLLVMLPSGSNHVRPLEILYQEMNETPSVADNNDGDFVLCYEVEQLSLTQVAVALIDGRRDFAEYAERLHSRTDVAWSRLPDLV